MSELRARTAGGRGPGACPATPKLRRSPRSCRNGCCALTCGRLVENRDTGRPLVRTGRQPDNLVGRTLAGDVQGYNRCGWSKNVGAWDSYPVATAACRGGLSPGMWSPQQKGFTASLPPASGPGVGFLAGRVCLEGRRHILPGFARMSGGTVPPARALRTRGARGCLHIAGVHDSLLGPCF